MDKKKYSFFEKIEKYTAIIVILVIFVFSVMNIPTIKKNANNVMKNNSNITLQKSIEDFEKGYKKDFTLKEEFVDFFNVLQVRIGNHIFGGMSYVKDENNVIHKFSTEYRDVQGFCEDMERLKVLSEDKGVPLLYVQAANREALLDSGIIDEMVYDDIVADELTDGISTLGIELLDMRKIYNISNEFPKEKVFLCSDVHMSTDAEIYQALVLAGYLEDNYGLIFPHKEYLRNMENYDKATYPFVGNFSREAGRCNEIVENFDLYYPRFDTDISINDNNGGPFFRGRFSEILMHAYEKNNPDRYTYWITNYLWFGAPYYTITNNICDGPKMLFITDSLGYRSLAYLALTSGEITILDPRFYDGNDYTTKALQGEYDVVIVLQQSRLCGYEMFPEN